MIFYKVQPLSGSLQPTLFMPLRPNHIHIISKIWKKQKKNPPKKTKTGEPTSFGVEGEKMWGLAGCGGGGVEHRGRPASFCSTEAVSVSPAGRQGEKAVRLSQSFAMQKIITIFVKALSACLVNFSPLFSHCVVLFDLNPWRVNWLNDKWNDWSHLYWPDGCQRVQCQWLTFLVLFNLASSLLIMWSWIDWLTTLNNWLYLYWPGGHRWVDRLIKWLASPWLTGW